MLRSLTKACVKQHKGFTRASADGMLGLGYCPTYPKPGFPGDICSGMLDLGYPQKYCEVLAKHARDKIKDSRKCGEVLAKKV